MYIAVNKSLNELQAASFWSGEMSCFSTKRDIKLTLWAADYII